MRSHSIDLLPVGRPANRPFPHFNRRRRVEVRVDKNTANVHPNLALVLLFVLTEVECGKGLL